MPIHVVRPCGKLNRIQTTCFSPLAMLNAWSSAKKPWSYPEVTDAVRRSVELRLRLLPYLYTAFADYYHRGIPPMRAMILAGQQDQVTVIEGKLDGEANPYAQARIVERNDQFMFGPDLLVAPVLEAGARKREVVLPGGTDWTDAWTGEAVRGGSRFSTEAPLEQIPMLERTDLGREFTAESEKSPQQLIEGYFENEKVRALMYYLTCHWGLEYDTTGLGF